MCGCIGIKILGHCVQQSLNKHTSGVAPVSQSKIPYCAEGKYKLLCMQLMDDGLAFALPPRTLLDFDCGTNVRTYRVYRPG